VNKTIDQNLKDKALAASIGMGSIPDKLYFKIGEVKKITGIEPHVLRYWESEFKIIRPQRATSKQRLYRRVDVENILTIKKLLYEDGYTVPGARKFLTANKGKKAKPAKTAAKQKTAREARPSTVPSKKTRSMLKDMKEDLLALREMLEKK
jgi:DNA-binding transcriptional MerR regulator